MSTIYTAALVSRIKITALIFSVGFPLYGFTSLGFIRKYNADISLYDNLIPRIVFNSLPYLLLWFSFESKKFSDTTKAWIWTISNPIIFTIACCINVVPIILEGNASLYFYVNSANILVFALSFMLVAPPLKLLLATIGLFLLLFHIPTSILLFRIDRYIFSLFLNDFLLINSLLVIGAYQLNRIHMRLAEIEHYKRAALEKENHDLYAELKRTTEESLKLQYAASIGNTIRQIAHDIKAPLGALKVISSDFPEIQSDKKALLQTVVNRITDISNELLKKSKTPQTSFFSNQNQNQILITKMSLKEILENLIEEKKLQYKNTSKFTFCLIETSPLDLQKLGFDFDITQLARTLSNLIDNSIESFEDKGEITIHYSVEHDQLKLTVTDNGSGIDPSILPKVGLEGFSFGKKNGNGLGLYSGKKWLNEMGGNMNIYSKMSHGTTVELTLPITPHNSRNLLKNE